MAIVGWLQGPGTLMGSMCLAFSGGCIVGALVTRLTRAPWVILFQSCVMLLACGIYVLWLWQMQSVEETPPVWLTVPCLFFPVWMLFVTFKWLGNYRLLKQLRDFKQQSRRNPNSDEQ